MCPVLPPISTRCHTPGCPLHWCKHVGKTTSPILRGRTWTASCAPLTATGSITSWKLRARTDLCIKFRETPPDDLLAPLGTPRREHGHSAVLMVLLVRTACLQSRTKIAGDKAKIFSGRTMPLRHRGVQRSVSPAPLRPPATRRERRAGQKFGKLAGVQCRYITLLCARPNGRASPGWCRGACLPT